ncbi:MAG: hypothetical protein ACE5KU_01015 [Nitrososphaerales archaeon]
MSEEERHITVNGKKYRRIAWGVMKVTRITDTHAVLEPVESHYPEEAKP